MNRIGKCVSYIKPEISCYELYDSSVLMGGLSSGDKKRPQAGDALPPGMEDEETETIDSKSFSYDDVEDSYF